MIKYTNEEDLRQKCVETLDAVMSRENSISRGRRLNAITETGASIKTSASNSKWRTGDKLRVDTQRLDRLYFNPKSWYMKQIPHSVRSTIEELNRTCGFIFDVEIGKKDQKKWELIFHVLTSAVTFANASEERGFDAVKEVFSWNVSTLRSRVVYFPIVLEQPFAKNSTVDAIFEDMFYMARPNDPETDRWTIPSIVNEGFAFWLKSSLRALSRMGIVVGSSTNSMHRVVDKLQKAQEWFYQNNARRDEIVSLGLSLSKNNSLEKEYAIVPEMRYRQQFEGTKNALSSIALTVQSAGASREVRLMPAPCVSSVSPTTNTDEIPVHFLHFEPEFGPSTRVSQHATIAPALPIVGWNWRTKKYTLIAHESHKYKIKTTYGGSENDKTVKLYVKLDESNSTGVHAYEEDINTNSLLPVHCFFSSTNKAGNVNLRTHYRAVLNLKILTPQTSDSEAWNEYLAGECIHALGDAALEEWSRKTYLKLLGHALRNGRKNLHSVIKVDYLLHDLSLEETQTVGSIVFDSYVRESSPLASRRNENQIPDEESETLDAFWRYFNMYLYRDQKTTTTLLGAFLQTTQKQYEVLFGKKIVAYPYGLETEAEVRAKFDAFAVENFGSFSDF